MKLQYYKDMFPPNELFGVEGYTLDKASQLTCPDEELESLIPYDFVGKTISGIGMDESHTAWVITFTDKTAITFIPGACDDRMIESKYTNGREVRIGKIPNRFVR